MVNLLIGPKGSGKTQQLFDLANKAVKECDGNIIFIKRSHKESCNISHDIRVIFMKDHPVITSGDEYIGFISGMLAANHDIQVVFIDGLLKHANISSENLIGFLDKLNSLSTAVDFYISCSVERDVVSSLENCKVLN